MYICIYIYIYIYTYIYICSHPPLALRSQVLDRSEAIREVQSDLERLFHDELGALARSADALRTLMRVKVKGGGGGLYKIFFYF